MAKETVYGKYTYNNRVRGTVKPSIKSKMQQDIDNTGVSESSIVAQALEEYYQRRQQPQTVSK